MRAFSSVGSAPMSFRMCPPAASAARATAGRQVLIESSPPPSQRSMKRTSCAASSSSPIGSRLVRALSAPTSMISAPSATSPRAFVRAASTSASPSPENESTERFTMPMMSGRRGHSSVCPRARSFMGRCPRKTRMDTKNKRLRARSFGAFRVFRGLSSWQRHKGNLPPAKARGLRVAHAFRQCHGLRETRAQFLHRMRV